MKRMKVCWMICISVWANVAAHAQSTYFADGYHGGVYGHYPLWQTQFMVDTLRKYKDWKINLEIEPETWDTVQVKDPGGYAAFKNFLEDKAMADRVEFVNPAYAQSYLYTCSGESMIRQFYYGIQKIQAHFPQVSFRTYSSEEPCFTSSLPQLLTSLGFKYASLKNPNTCWGGYVKNYGGEMMNWIGPDGTTIKLVPRYTMEALEKNSTWQTTAWVNRDAYMQAAFAQGIKHPVGMCLQDAGWKNGRWLAANKKGSIYTTWRNYFEQIADTSNSVTWRVSQEDIRISLVWGAQVLQRIAQQVRASENKLITAEKMAAMAAISQHTAWPAKAIDDAWRSLLLSQHHDCWIVPYNGRKGNTWADKVKVWTTNTGNIADSIIHTSIIKNMGDAPDIITVYNTLGAPRTAPVFINLPATFSSAKQLHITDDGKQLPAQLIINEHGMAQLVFNASVPAMGYKQFRIRSGETPVKKGSRIQTRADGKVDMETDLYKVVIDPAKGGAIVSLQTKKNGKEFVDTTTGYGFNTLQGNFYNEGGFNVSAAKHATVQVLDNGPILIKLSVTHIIASCKYVQTITMIQGESRIDCTVRLAWEHNTGIGEAYKQNGGYEATDLHKAFYNDTAKLLVTFPVALKKQQVFADAPFDVTRSAMNNTFYNTWDSIKNNVMLNWADVTDEDKGDGFALLTDHTTGYVHGENFPLALTIQYSGVGLWGRNYSIDGSTSVHYSLMPHKGNWQAAKLATATDAWHEPLLAFPGNAGKHATQSFIDCGQGGWQVSSFVLQDDHYLLRLYNAEGDNKEHQVKLGFPVTKASLVQLNGQLVRDLSIQDHAIKLSIPEKGFVTIQLTPAN